MSDSGEELVYLYVDTMYEPNVMAYPNSDKPGAFIDTTPGADKEARTLSWFSWCRLRERRELTKYTSYRAPVAIVGSNRMNQHHCRRHQLGFAIRAALFAALFAAVLAPTVSFAGASAHDQEVCKHYIAARWAGDSRGKYQYWQCLKFARHYQGAFTGTSGDNIHGIFRYGELLCETGYYKRGYQRGQLCSPWPQVSGGHWSGSAPALLHCDPGYVYALDRVPMPGQLLLPPEQHCIRRPAGSSRQWCPSGYLSIGGNRNKMIPPAAHCMKQ